MLVILGDNLFDFDLDGIISFFRKNKRTTVGIYDLKDKEQAKNFGVFEIKNNKIISCEEKPQNPKATIISTGIYLFPREYLNKIADYVKTEKPKDGPGYLILDLLKTQDIHIFQFDGKWFDIGTREVYDKLKNGF